MKFSPLSAETKLSSENVDTQGLVIQLDFRSSRSYSSFPTRSHALLGVEPTLYPSLGHPLAIRYQSCFKQTYDQH